MKRSMRAFVATLSFLVANAALGADPDLTRAEQLVREGKYPEAYDLLAAFEDASKGDPTFNYLLGRAALGTKRAEKAQALVERSLAQRPNDVAAHLALGRRRRGARLPGPLPDLQEFRRGARPARRGRHARDDAADGVHTALHRHPDHVERLGRAERGDTLNLARAHRHVPQPLQQ
jgi:hypothetical protein